MAGSGGGPSAPSSSTAVMAGYLLKKKRKRIQGMAKRYFSLSPSVRPVKSPSRARLIRNRRASCRTRSIRTDRCETRCS